jgi:hypothetical protein
VGGRSPDRVRRDRSSSRRRPVSQSSHGERAKFAVLMCFVLKGVGGAQATRSFACTPDSPLRTRRADSQPARGRRAMPERRRLTADTRPVRQRRVAVGKRELEPGALCGGDFVSYRTTLSGSPAFDYLGSFDATETTSPTPPRCMPTNNNPCFDHLGSGAGSGCTAPGTPPVPASTFPVPPANLAAQRTCGGSSGLPTVPDGELPGRAHIHHHHRQPRNGQRHRHHRDRLPTRRGGSGVGRHTASARSMPAPVAGPSRCCQPGPPARSPWSCGCCQPRPDRRSPTSWR